MKKWIKILLVVLLVVALSVGVFFTLKALGITSIEGIRELVAKCGAWGWIVFMALFIICSVLLCFIPGTSATFIAVSIIMFGALKGFIISTVSVFLASSLMFWIGNTLGEKTVAKIVGKDSLEKAQNLLDVKSKMLLPLMFLFPVFPDDALCMVAGMTKMRYWYFALVAAIFRTVGIATICFLGSGFIDWSQLKITDWFVLINVCVFDIFLIFKYQDRLEKLIIRKDKKTEVKRPIKKKPANRNIIENLEKKLEKYKETIRLKKYCNEEQLHNIEKKIAATEQNLARIKGLTKYKTEPEQPKEVETPPAKKVIQEAICKEIEKIMVNQFPKVNYSIKRSQTTESVYLSFTNENGIEKIIRFSDHRSSRGIKQYSYKAISKNKDMVRIINSGLKALSNKTVIVMLDRLEKEGKNDS